MNKILTAAFGMPALAAPISAQRAGSDDYTIEANVPVMANDVTSSPYRFVQPITIGVTKDYGADTRRKIYGKLRAKAIKLGWETVVLVIKGKTHMTAWAWNRREYTGRAIRYVDRSCAPSSL